MSIDFDWSTFEDQGWDIRFTLVNGRMDICHTSDRADLMEFVAFCYENPEHLFHAEGQQFSASWLVERYISPKTRANEPTSVSEAEVAAEFARRWKIRQI